MAIGTAFVALLMVANFAPAAHAETSPIDPLDDGDTSSEVIEVEITGPVTPETQDPSDTAEPGSEDASRSAAICTFIQRVDFVHISSSPGAMAAQSHGNWDKGNCTNYTLADVTTQIDRKNFIGLWQAVGAPGKNRLAPNPSGLTSGGAGRVTARYVCNGTAAGSFRSYTNIDVVGYADTPNSQFSPAVNLICG